MAVDKNAVIREAQKFAGKGQFDKAIAEWMKLVKDFPDDSNIFNTIGDLCLKKNAKAEAVDAYRKAADILAADGFTSKAIALYKKVLNIDPNRIEVHLAMGDMNAEKGLVGNALESYKVVADHYTKQKKKAEALGIYQKMADLNPANVAFRVKLAEMYLKEGMKAEAIKAYLDASNVHIAKNTFQEARQLFEKVLAVDPGNKDVYYKAGLVYYKENKFTEACKALKSVFESDPANEEVTDLYLDALVKAGRTADTEDVYRKLLAANPARLDLREKLYQSSLDRKDYAKALTELGALAQAKTEDMNFDAAAELFRGFIAVTDDPVVAANVLAELFTKRGRAKDAAKELVQIGDLLSSRGSMDDARDVLSRALVLDPAQEEAAQRLESLRASASATAPAALPEEAAPEEPEIVELAPEEPEPPAVVERPAAAPPPPAEEEDPAIVEALTEADVLIKYGLGAKAVDKLEALVRTHPEHTGIRSRLLEMYRDQKKTDKAVIQALMLAELFEKKGQQSESEAVLQAALDLAPGNVQIMTKLGLSPVEEEVVEEPEAIEAITEEVPEQALPAATAGEIPPVDFGEAPPPSPAEEIPFDAEPAPAGEVGEGISFIPPGGGEGPLDVEMPAPEEPAREAVEYQPPSSYEQEQEAAPAFEEETPAQEPLAGMDTSEMWAEAEFYYQQGLFDEARKHYERILELQPGDAKVMARIVEIAREKEDVQEFSRLAEAVEGLEGLVESPAGTTEDRMTAADVNAVKSLMGEIAEMQQAAKRPAPPPPPARPAAPQAREEEFVDIGLDLGDEAEPAAPAAAARETSDDFFDLAAELRDELSAAAPPPGEAEAAADQSLDEIFEEFKKGVEAHEKKEDVDTHYNLGVAYKEMGLLDDAISEFSMTPEGEMRFIQSRYMLGLCYLEKAEYQTAITELQNALGYSYSLGQASEERLGMHYDLGLAYQGVGDNEAALQEFQKVHNLDPSYREVATKLQELKQGDFISLDSIKEDIEKEVSFKFLEEGARIEREEKTKRNEKVKG